VQNRSTSLQFSVNQTVYPQGRSSGEGYDVYIPFQARYLDNDEQPISGATCNVINDETSDVASLTYNATTENYTGQVLDYMMYDLVNFNVSCSKTNYNSVINSTSANVWWQVYLWAWDNLSYGSPNYYTTDWLRETPTTGNVHNLTEILNTSIGKNELNEQFYFYAAGVNGSFLKDYNMIGLHTLRLNISVNDTECRPYLCTHINEFGLNELIEYCGSPVSIPVDTPTLIEQNITMNYTISQSDYLVLHLHLNCSSAVSEQVTVYYNYTGQQPNVEIRHAEPTLMASFLSGYEQIDANYTIGPNRAVNSTGKIWITFNNKIGRASCRERVLAMV
jgi:hypothetical protein